MQSKLEQRIRHFKHFEVYNPIAAQHLDSFVDVEYFPRGNDSYMMGLVEQAKKFIAKKINQ